MDGAYNNFCPGSLGIVDPADVSKVVFEGAVARLAGVEIAEVETHAAAGGPTREQVSQTSGTRSPTGSRNPLSACGRSSPLARWDGRVVARLMETPVPEFPSDPGTEATRSLLAFDSDEQGSDGFGPISAHRSRTSVRASVGSPKRSLTSVLGIHARRSREHLSLRGHVDRLCGSRDR